MPTDDPAWPIKNALMRSTRCRGSPGFVWRPGRQKQRDGIWSRRTQRLSHMIVWRRARSSALRGNTVPSALRRTGNGSSDETPQLYVVVAAGHTRRRRKLGSSRHLTGTPQKHAFGWEAAPHKLWASSDAHRPQRQLYPDGEKRELEPGAKRRETETPCRCGRVIRNRSGAPNKHAAVHAPTGMALQPRVDVYTRPRKRSLWVLPRTPNRIGPDGKDELFEPMHANLPPSTLYKVPDDVGNGVVIPRRRGSMQQPCARRRCTGSRSAGMKSMARSAQQPAK